MKIESSEEKKKTRKKYINNKYLPNRNQRGQIIYQQRERKKEKEGDSVIGISKQNANEAQMKKNNKLTNNTQYI